MADAEHAFALTLAHLKQIRDDLCGKILAGLANAHAEIKALPAYLPRASAVRTGDAVALDVGGTAMRAGWLRMRADSARMLAPLLHASVPRRGPARAFFARQARLVVQACPQSRIALGYCFSYPARITPSLEGVSTQLTKGIRIDGLVGRSVGSELAEALRKRGRHAEPVRVLNDTVATLLAATFVAPAYSYYIGLVVGTGTNMAGFFPVKRIAKLTAAQRRGWRDEDEMAVNLETGNFTPPHLSHYDAMLDASAPGELPGAQRFEKAIAGAYLPGLFRCAVGDGALRAAGIDPKALDARSIAELRPRPDALGRTATAVLDRSADLVAAGLAGLIQAYEPAPRNVAILAEGSVFWGILGYRNRVRRRLMRLRPGDAITFLRYPRRRGFPPPTLLGAASAALGPADTIAASCAALAWDPPRALG
jgi:hexokinase